MTTQTPALDNELSETHTDTHTENHSPSRETSLETDTSQDQPYATANKATHVKLTGRLINFTRLMLQGDDIHDILSKLEKKLGRQRQSRLPVVVSCQDPLDLSALWEGLWQLGLQPIGIVTGSMDEQAQAQHIAIFPVDGERIDGKPSSQKKSTAKEASEKSSEATASKTASDVHNPSDEAAQTNKLVVDNSQTSHVEGDLVHQQILRSGQSINHVGGDVILTKGINAGAEAITDYSLHVYGKAEGRLVAGATGDKNAKIFCLRFNPSLVSVAGTYCLKENIPSEFLDKAVQVSFVEGQGLVFNLMD